MTRARGRDADMTQGNILRQYIDFALPLTVGLLFQQLYSAVDSIVVGNFVGETALGAVGSTGNIINMLIGVCNGLSLGAGAVISQAYGAKNHERISKAVHTTMLMTFLLCIVATAVGVAIVKPSLQLMRTPDSMLVEATEYLTIYFEGIAGLLIYNMGSAILRAVGDSRRPLYFLVFSAVVNTVLDLLFVICFHMGVAGVAYATIIAQAASAVLVLYVLTKENASFGLRWNKLHIDGRTMKEILIIGLPASIQQGLTSFSNVFVQAYINDLGDLSASGWAAYNRIDMFLMVPTTAIGQASTTFVAQELGRAAAGARAQRRSHRHPAVAGVHGRVRCRRDTAGAPAAVDYFPVGGGHFLRSALPVYHHTLLPCHFVQPDVCGRTARHRRIGGSDGYHAVLVRRIPPNLPLSRHNDDCG